VTACAGPDGITLDGDDAFTLGVAASRLVVALHGEGLPSTVDRPQASGAHLRVRVTLG
jgi:hypothetical protein